MNHNFNPFYFIQSIDESSDPDLIRLPEKYPPVHTWDPPFCGDIPMRIARDGTWYYQDSPIARYRMIQVFSRILRLDDDGCYYLVTPVEKVRIIVEDAPFVAIQVSKQGDDQRQELIFTTQTGDQVILDQQYPLWMLDKNNQSIPYLLVRDQLTARIHHNVFYQLVEWAIPATPDAQLLGVWSGGVFFELGRVE